MVISNTCKSMLLGVFLFSNSCFAMDVAKDNKEARDLGPQPAQQFDAADYRAQSPMKESTRTIWGTLMGGTLGLLCSLMMDTPNNFSSKIMQQVALGTAIGAVSGAGLGYLIALSEREENKKREEAIKLTRGGDVRAAACEGNTFALCAWHKALRYRQSDPFRCTDRSGRSVLHYAAGNGHTQACKYIQDNSNAYEDVTRVVDSSDNGVYIPGAHAAVHSTTREKSRFFYIDAGDYGSRRTPLHYALYGNHIQAAITLLNAGANPDLSDYNGQTAQTLITERLPQHRNQFAQPLHNAQAKCQRKFVAPTRTTETTTSVGVSNGESNSSLTWQSHS